MLWLNPLNVETFPDGLLDALDDVDLVTSVRQSRPDHSIEGRLRARMQADALQPVASLEDDDDDATATAVQAETVRKTPYSEEDIKEATQFLRLAVRSWSHLTTATSHLFEFRQRIGWSLSWITFEGDTPTVFGVARSTMTKRTWRQTVLERTRSRMIEQMDYSFVICALK